MAEPLRVESCSPLAFAKPVVELVFFRTAWAVAATSVLSVGLLGAEQSAGEIAL